MLSSKGHDSTTMEASPVARIKGNLAIASWEVVVPQPDCWREIPIWNVIWVALYCFWAAEMLPSRTPIVRFGLVSARTVSAPLIARR